MRFGSIVGGLSDIDREVRDSTFDGKGRSSAPDADSLERDKESLTGSCESCRKMPLVVPGRIEAEAGS